MKKKNNYTILGIMAAIINVIFLIGIYMVYSPIGKVANMMNSYGDFSYNDVLDTASMVNSAINGIKLSAFGFIATIVIAIFLVVYYIYEDRKKAILTSCMTNVVEVFVLWSIIGSLGGLVSSGFGSFDYDTLSQAVSIISNLRMLLIVVLIGFIFHGVIALQLLHVIHLSFLNSWIPSQETVKVQSIQEDSFQQAVKEKVSQDDVYQIFDNYENQDKGGH